MTTKPLMTSDAVNALTDEVAQIGADVRANKYYFVSRAESKLNAIQDRVNYKRQNAEQKQGTLSEKLEAVFTQFREAAEITKRAIGDRKAENTQLRQERCQQITTGLTTAAKYALGPIATAGFAWYQQSLFPVYAYAAVRSIGYIAGKLQPAPQNNPPQLAPAAPAADAAPQQKTEPAAQQVPATTTAPAAVEITPQQSPIPQPALATQPLTVNPPATAPADRTKAPFKYLSKLHPQSNRKRTFQFSDKKPTPVVAPSAPSDDDCKDGQPAPAPSKARFGGVQVLPSFTPSTSTRPQTNPAHYKFESLIPGDVVATTNQYKVYKNNRGKLACSSIVGKWLVRMMAQKNQMTPKELDGCIIDGVEMHSELNGTKDLPPVWPTVQKKLSLKSSANERKAMIDRPYKNDEGYEPLPINILEGIVKPFRSKPLVYISLVISGGGKVAQTFGLVAEKDKEGDFTFKFFNSHGTDSSRNEMDGREDQPARVNYFTKEGRSFYPEFRAHLANLIGALSSTDKMITIETYEVTL